MIWKTHAEMVAKLSKPPADIIKGLSEQDVDLWHAVTGVVSEAGELIDAVKKVVIYGKPADLSNIEEELGDLEYYMEQMRQNLGLDRDVILRRNMEKLERRYGVSYSDQKAVDRADKKLVMQNFERPQRGDTGRD